MTGQPERDNDLWGLRGRVTNNPFQCALLSLRFVSRGRQWPEISCLCGLKGKELKFTNKPPCCSPRCFNTDWVETQSHREAALHCQTLLWCEGYEAPIRRNFAMQLDRCSRVKQTHKYYHFGNVVASPVGLGSNPFTT